ncbi:MAG: 4Fe-4S binding protein [Patescibacteria group bacterium]
MKFCAGCNACVGMCEQKCIKKQGRGQPPIFDLNNCIGCGKCVEACFRDKLIEMIEIVFNQVWHFEYCDGCGKCVDACKRQCIIKKETKKGWCDGFNIFFDVERCNGCELCMQTCPKQAISIIGAPYELSNMERLGMHD